MHRSKIGEVVVDSCMHGTWFDREELGAVMRHVRGDAPLHRGAEAAFLAEEEDRKKYGPLKDVVAFFRDLVPPKS
jgi:Zn-finger nucleic acid-binding protein